MYFYALVAVAVFTICESTFRNRRKRHVISDPSHSWNDSEIEYEISSTDYDKAGLATIAAAFKHIESRTCVRFVPRQKNSSAPYLYLAEDKESPGSCITTVGRERTNKTNLVGLGSLCMEMGVVVHEIMHRLGFYHEHSRKDRDNYITIDRKNIKPGEEDNFNNYESNDLGLPYDYQSVMHYHQRAFSKNGKSTILPKDKRFLLGQRTGLSDLDAKKINHLFRCKTGDTRYKKRLEKVVSLLKTMKLPDLATLPLINCPNNQMSQKECQDWQNQGFCGEKEIAAACPRVCSYTLSCRLWVSNGYCHDDHRKELMPILCRCTC